MVVGVGTVVLRLHDCNSLKVKRKIVKAAIGRIRSHFNVSAAEVGANDSHQRALIGFALVGNDGGLVNAKVDKIFNMVEEMALAEVIDTEMEIIHL
jgi:hypothetical protein